MEYGFLLQNNIYNDLTLSKPIIEGKQLSEIKRAFLVTNRAGSRVSLIIFFSLESIYFLILLVSSIADIMLVMASYLGTS